jgi:hypothetical protein
VTRGLIAGVGMRSGVVCLASVLFVISRNAVDDSHGALFVAMAAGALPPYSSSADSPLASRARITVGPNFTFQSMIAHARIMK